LAKVVVTYPIARKIRMAETTLAAYKARRGMVFAGRLVRDKGVFFLLERWPDIQRTLGIRTLRIIGTGTEMAALKAKAKADRLTGVTFMGAQTLGAVEAEMAKAAYVIVPSIWQEPFGNVGVEGLASGAVVIVSNRGGLPEAVGGEGIVFPFEEDFTDALKRARAKREGLCRSKAALDAHRRRVNAHLEQFGEAAVMRVIGKAIGPALMER
jgi:glycosyltransferase involved in cell wall biosynthesis